MCPYMTSGQFIKENILLKNQLTVQQVAKEMDIEADVFQAVVFDQIVLPVEWAFKLSNRFNLPINILLSTIR